MFCLLAVFPTPSQARGQDLPPDETVRGILEERVALGRNPGIVVGLVDRHGPRVVAAGTSGTEGVELDGQTVFEIGSITKVFTAAVLQDMVLKGQVGWNDPVGDFLPGHVSVPGEPHRDVTLLDLATHRSGLPRMPVNFTPADVRNPYADYTVEQLYEFLSGASLVYPIGSDWEYSNLGMGLLGHVLSLRAGTTYERVVRERILDPLGMHDTGIDLAPPVAAPHAQGHGVKGEPVPGWDIPTLAGAGALRSTGLDMILFAAANLVKEEGDVFEALHGTHRVRTPEVAQGLSMALGWLVNHRLPDRPILWHNGGTGGFHSFLGLDKEGHRAVVVLTNGTASIDDIGFHLLDSRSPLSPPEPMGGGSETGERPTPGAAKVEKGEATG
jgi:CubicO group peptidase (beta-lactamase class C family)